MIPLTQFGQFITYRNIPATTKSPWCFWKC